LTEENDRMTIGGDPLGIAGTRPKRYDTLSRVGTETLRTKIWWGPGDNRTDYRYSAAQSTITPNRIGLVVLGQCGTRRYRVDGVLVEDWLLERWPSTPCGHTQKHICNIIRRQLREVLNPITPWGFDVTLVEWEH
jgi:hypothetical protein